MPENPEVARQAEKLKKWLNNTKIIKVEWDTISKFSRKKIPGFDSVEFPLFVKDVFSRGKIIVLKCQNDKVIYITSHLGMSGYYTFNEEKHCNLWFVLQKGNKEEKLYFNDQRHFGNFTFSENLTEIWKKNGPCLLTSGLVRYQKISIKNLNEHQKIIDRKYWHKCFKKSKMKICDFLMEQKKFSGIGNYLRSEILFRSKIHPECLVSNLSEKNIDTLYEKTIETIYLAYRNTDFKLYVYQQSCDPYGNSISTISSKNRTIYFSPKIQKNL